MEIPPVHPGAGNPRRVVNGTALCLVLSFGVGDGRFRLRTTWPLAVVRLRSESKHVTRRSIVCWRIRVARCRPRCAAPTVLSTYASRYNTRSHSRAAVMRGVGKYPTIYRRVLSTQFDRHIFITLNDYLCLHQVGQFVWQVYHI